MYNADAYARSLTALLPPGAAFSTEAQSKIAAFFAALALELARVDARGVDLLNEADPRTIHELLAEWEGMLGLPDPCVPYSQDTASRVRGVVAKYLAQGGQSPAYFIAVAAALGYVITITEFQPYTVQSNVAAAIYGPAWGYAWRVNAPLQSVHKATVHDDCAQPIANWGNEAMECVLRRLKPAHTIVIFSYS